MLVLISLLVLLIVFPGAVLSVFGIGLLLVLVCGVWGLLERVLPFFIAAGLLACVTVFALNPAMWTLNIALGLLLGVGVWVPPLVRCFREIRQPL